jgi:hypothetical protein
VVGNQSLPFNDYNVAKETINNLINHEAINWYLYGQKKN